MTDKEETKINCSIFQKQEPVIKDIIGQINKIKDAAEKAKLAEKLQEEVGILLSCPDYKAENFACKGCHFIAKLRKRTTEIIIKAKKLE